MARVIAYCGLVCSDCPAYVATKADDPNAIERVAAQWREEYNAPTMTAESVWCDGCPGKEGRKCAHCAECDIRACAVSKGYATCADCAEYPCERLGAFFGYVPQARTTLDALRPDA